MTEIKLLSSCVIFICSNIMNENMWQCLHVFQLKYCKQFSLTAILPAAAILYFINNIRWKFVWHNDIRIPRSHLFILLPELTNIFPSEIRWRVDWHITTNPSNELVFIFKEEQKLLPFRVVRWNILRLGTTISFEASLHTFQSTWQQRPSLNL